MNDQDSQFDSLLPPLKLDRRGFIATSVAAGFSLAAGQAVAQTAIVTDAAGLLAGRVDIPVADGKMPAYRAAPPGKKNLPTLLVVPEIFGVHEYIQDICRRLAHLGYLAVAPELFARQGDPSRYTDIPKLQAEIISKVPDAQVQRDLDAASAWAAEHGGDAGRLGILGFAGADARSGSMPRTIPSCARRCLVRAAGRRAQRAEAAPGTERGRGPEGAGAGRLWRQGRRHSVGGR